MTLAEMAELIKVLPIYQAWRVYQRILEEYAPDFWKFDSWQTEDIYQFLKLGDLAWDYARGGGKTRNGSAICVFTTLRNLDSMWVASSGKQLSNAMKYWLKNPFVIKFQRSPNQRIIRLINGLDFDIGILNPLTVRGPHVKCIYWDEMAQMSQEVLEDATGMGSHATKLYQLYMSTPVVNTPFHDVCYRQPVIIRTYIDCIHLNQAYIESLKAWMNPNKWAQEYMCVFTGLGGACFSLDKVHYKVYKGVLLKSKYVGVDVNPREGHTVNVIQWSADRMNCALTDWFPKTGKCVDKDLLISVLMSYDINPLVKTIEFETNGVGLPIWDDLMKAGCTKGIPMHWDDKKKTRRVNSLYDKNHWIPHKHTYSQVTALSWDARGEKVDKPKSKQWHWADGYLHSAQPAPIIWT